jgi:hypothetical protein
VKINQVQFFKGISLNTLFLFDRYNKNVGLDFVNVRYDCPSFKTLEMDNDLVTLSIVDCISVVDRCGNLDKLIV